MASSSLRTSLAHKVPSASGRGSESGRSERPRAFVRRELGLAEGDGLLDVGFGEDVDEFRGDQSSE
jgi:hypothetical protein